MRIRFRFGPFTFGKTGVRLSIWRYGWGFSIPLFNKKHAKSFGKLKLGPFIVNIDSRSKTRKSKTSYPLIVQEQRRIHNQAYEKWNKNDDEKLMQFLRQGKKIKELSEIFGRSPGAIRSRIDKILQ